NFGHCCEQCNALNQNRVLAHGVNPYSRTSADGSGSWIIDNSKLLTRVHEHSSCEQVIVSPHAGSLIDAVCCLMYHQSMRVSCISIHPPEVCERGLFPKLPSL
ncbi:MAG: hypothetical protein MUC83_11910, partial [Pirellula sp.]|nr:hypothetical protein [Pirellula sp.]